MNLFSVLINPQGEELDLNERALVCSAANILQVGEFQILQLAYRAWFGHDLPDAMADELFSSYMLRNQVPHWVRHFARATLARDKAGLAPQYPPWPSTDSGHPHTAPLPSARKFIAVAGLVGLCLLGALAVATMMTTERTSVLPPFFERTHLPDDGGGRASAREPHR